MSKYTKKEFSEKIQKSTKTLERWDQSGRFQASRDSNGRPFYTNDHFLVYKSTLDRSGKYNEERLLKSLNGELERAQIAIDPFHGVEGKYPNENARLSKAGSLSDLLEPTHQKLDSLSEIHDLIDITSSEGVDGLMYEEDGGGVLNIYVERELSDKDVVYYTQGIEKSMKLMRDNLDIPLPILNSYDHLKFIIVEDILEYAGPQTEQGMGSKPSALFDPELWAIIIPVGSKPTLSHEIFHALDFFIGTIWYGKIIKMSEMVYEKLYKQEDMDKTVRHIYSKELDNVEKLIAMFIFTAKPYRMRLKELGNDLKLKSEWKRYLIDIGEVLSRVGEIMSNDDDVFSSANHDDIKDSGFDTEDMKDEDDGKVKEEASFIKDQSLLPQMADKVDKLQEALRRFIQSYPSWKLKIMNGYSR